MSKGGGQGGGSPINLTTILALATILGGLALGSKRLQSSRPVAPAGPPSASIGEQRLEARLWEDPFLERDAGPSHAGQPGERDLRDLARQVHLRHSPKAGVLVLPVMVSGSPYGEDREGRIRTRFAVVSALAERGFAPEESTHLGQVETRWPDTRQLGEWRAQGPHPAAPDRPSPPTHLLDSGAVTLSARYEWFRWREFQPASAQPGVATNGVTGPIAYPVDRVLVLWLRESFFTDDPATRYALFFSPFVTPAPESPDAPASTPGPVVRMIGPRSSTLLRGMLPGPFAPGQDPRDAQALRAARDASRPVLGRLALYSPTTTAMDAVLVADPGGRADRTAVRAGLQALGFARAAFFSPDDAAAAAEAYAELELRGARLRSDKAPDHVVLISEWDTFFGRKLSLTYAARLAMLQPGNAPGTPEQFVREYRAHTRTNPPNFHSFVYLRGLDGQSVDGSGPDPAGGDGGAGRRPASFEELRDWTPDANRAEGRAQFDYLSRLGEEIGNLDDGLRRDGKGRVRAIGIVGSDTYDTLLILQALRQRFPGALFFTTDLDARFWAPAENAWARNLIVISGYGTRLDASLQGATPPFRDSYQTATFTATLAALDHPGLSSLEQVPLRRFEIGRAQAVDISVASSQATLLPPTPGAGGTRTVPLHPPTPHEQAVARSARGSSSPAMPAGLLLALGGLLALATLFARSLDEHASIGFHRLRATLDYTPEDIGEEADARALVAAMDAPSRTGSWREVRDRIPAGAGQPGQPTLVVALVSALNSVLAGAPAGAPGQAAPGPAPGSGASGARSPRPTPSPARPGPDRLRELLGGNLWQRRRQLDRELDALSQPLESDPELADTLRAASDSREAARRTYHLKRMHLAGMVLAALASVILGWWLVRLVRHDAWGIPDGEPFSLADGVSAWPAELLRLLTGFLAAGATFALHIRLRRSFYELTRRYRLPLRRPAAGFPGVPGRVDAGQLWLRLYEAGTLRGRLSGAAPWVFWYLILGSGVIGMGGAPTSPTRGALLNGGTPWPGILWAGTATLVGLVIAATHRPGRRTGWLLAAHALLASLPFLPNTPPPLDRLLLWFVIGAFLFLTFLALETALRCRRFILQLGAHPTEYPLATRRHFARRHGGIHHSFLDEWIDMQLVADLTERIGAMLWLPSIVLLLLFAARSEWWDRWPWTPGLLVIMSFNFLLVLLCVVVVQRAARAAKRAAREQHAAKIRNANAVLADNPAANDAAQAARLLEEIDELSRGAFVGFWQNPVVGALLVPSGGTVMIELVIWMLGR